MSFDISSVTEVHNTSFKEQVNEMLKEGWVLLSTAPGQDESGYPITMFALGKPGNT